MSTICSFMSSQSMGSDALPCTPKRSNSTWSLIRLGFIDSCNGWIRRADVIDRRVSPFCVFLTRAFPLPALSNQRKESLNHLTQRHAGADMQLPEG
jgi:hypothetical protein